LKLRYKQSLRGLEDEERIVECKKREKKEEIHVRFQCKFVIKGKKIDNIEVEENKIDFIDQEVTIKKCSPLAVKYMKNIQTFGEEAKFRKKLYLLEDAELKKNKNDFTIIGKIKDKDFDNDEVTLTIFNDKKNNGLNIECSIKKKKGKYNIICKPEKNIKGYLDSAFGDFGEENLLINFKDEQNSEIDFVAKKEDKDEDKKEDKDEDKKEDKDKDKKEDKDEDKNEDKKEDKKKNNDDDDDDDEKKSKKENKKVVIKKKKIVEDEDTDSMEEGNWLNNNSILIYIIMGSLFFLLIILVFCRYCQVEVQSKKSQNLENSPMDKVKFASQSSD
jgi:hypothetical protein